MDNNKKPICQIRNRHDHQHGLIMQRLVINPSPGHPFPPLLLLHLLCHGRRLRQSCPSRCPPELNLPRTATPGDALKPSTGHEPTSPRPERAAPPRKPTTTGSEFVEHRNPAASRAWRVSNEAGNRKSPNFLHGHRRHTASDLIWTPCNPCTLCPDQPSTVFDPQGSTSYSKLPCSSPSCSALPHVCVPLSDDCQYIYRYGDQSTTSGYLSSETFTLGSASFENVGFGCGTMNWGFHEGAGLVGLNRGRLSLISQLGAFVGYQFSYCLSGLESGSSGSSRLVFGPSSSLPSSSAGAITLPLLINSRNPDFYFVDLEGIRVGGKRLPIEASAFRFRQGSTGCVVVDSGSALTYLVAEAYREVKQAFITAIGLPVADGPTPAGSDLCFQGLVDSSSIPTLTLHFSSGDFCSPQDNYFIVDKDSRLSCIAINETPMGMSIIGAFMQQNVHIHYDLGNNLITFTPAQCDQL
ncbi:Aspartic proteinase nepenthesin-1 [Nymphaea thermarum]|nr:Aspartic proteinase nepenthesin-1 [Nymphaea thermarum]